MAAGRRIVVLDNHWVRGGQGDAVRAALPGEHVEVIGIDRVPECGSNDEVLRAHGLDAASQRGSDSKRDDVPLLGHRRHAAHDGAGRHLRVGGRDEEVLGRRIEMARMQTAGLTDAEIAVALVQHHGEATRPRPGAA